MARLYPVRETGCPGYLVENASFAQLTLIFELPQIWQLPTVLETRTGSWSR
jgi:hypothetical protein